MASSSGTVPYELPWCVQCSSLHHLLLTCFLRVEKYRPAALDDVVGNAETIDRLKVIAKDGNCPHMIISVCAHFPPQRRLCLIS